MQVSIVEFEVRKSLQEEGEKLDGIYAGNPKRATAKPTTEMMLTVFRGLSLNVVSIDGYECYYLTSLSPVQIRIVTLLNFPLTIYNELAIQSEKLAVKMSER